MKQYHKLLNDNTNNIKELIEVCKCISNDDTGYTDMLAQTLAKSVIRIFNNPITLREYSESNGQTISEFVEDIMISATALGSMKIDESDDNVYTFNTTDEKTKLKLTVERI